MNKAVNRKVICDVLLENATHDPDIFVLCSDSMGSSSVTAFKEQYPQQFVEVGIAEQNLVTIAAGMAKCGKKTFAFSPACFLSTRSMEQVKVDCGYNDTNVTLVGVSGGVSYGALGLTHHATQDIATMGSCPNMRVYLPSDAFVTSSLLRALLEDRHPAYIRVGRSASPAIYGSDTAFTLNQALTAYDGGDGQTADYAVIACGDQVAAAVEAAKTLKEEGIRVRVIDMYCVKPVDRAAILRAAQETKGILTVEEHSICGGLGSIVAQVTAAECPCRVKNLALPDEPVIAGEEPEVLAYYGLDAAGIVRALKAY